MATIIEFPAVNASRQRLRLLQLASSTMPVGAFTYSQGLEWAVECGWVDSASKLESWIGDLLDASVAGVDVPLFLRFHDAWRSVDLDRVAHWSRLLSACRETDELRAEERNRGRAFTRLLDRLEPGVPGHVLDLVADCQLAGQAWLCVQWDLDPVAAMETFAWSWMENLVLAGVKLIPLGQSDGQQLVLRLGDRVPAAVARGAELGDDAIGAGCPAQAIASSLHETQYTRLFRS